MDIIEMQQQTGSAYILPKPLVLLSNERQTKSYHKQVKDY